MEIMGKCPFWGEPCIKEECSAFQRISKCIWNKDDKRYRAFEKKLDYVIETSKTTPDDREWFAVGIPYCRVLDRELPMKIEKFWRPVNDA